MPRDARSSRSSRRLWLSLTPFLVLGVLVAIPIALLAVPTSALESGRSLCLWKNLFGVQCPGCGITRAASCALHGRLADAWAHNPLIVIVGPLLAIVWAWSIRFHWRRVRAILRTR